MFYKKLIDLMSPPQDVDTNSIEKNIRLAEKYYNIKLYTRYEYDTDGRRDVLQL